MNHRIGLGTFTDGEEQESAFRSWAAANGVAVVGGGPVLRGGRP